MTITLELHWYYVPIVLATAGLLVLLREPRNHGGYMAGAYSGVLALMFFIAAVASLVTGVFAS